jgi:hypothetical protein
MWAAIRLFAGPGGLADHRRLVAGEVDHAVGDHDADGGVGQGHVLDVALAELDALDPHLGGVAAGAG